MPPAPTPQDEKEAPATPVEPSEETVIAVDNGTGAPQGPAALNVYKKYVKLQRKLQRAFQKDLAESAGLNETTGTKTDEETEEEDDDSEMQDDPTAPPGDESDSDESSVGGDLPPPADPDLPPGALSKTTGGNVKSRVKRSGRGRHRSGRKGVFDNVDREMFAYLRSKDPLQDAYALGQRPRGMGLPGRHNLPFSDPPPLPGQEGKRKKKKNRVRASKLEFKRLDELYNKNVHDFYLAETNQSSNKKDDQWEEYCFVVRRRFGMFPCQKGYGSITGDVDWQNKYQKTFIDIKSPDLRDVLREVFKDVKGIGLREETPSIEPNLLFAYLPQIEEKLQKEKSKPEEEQNKKMFEHVQLLIKYINEDYSSTAKRLYPLLDHHEITFDLLWALFLPNTIVYTVCAGSNEPRCIKLDWGEQKETMDRGKFFQLDCHYVDFDGKEIGEAKGIFEIDDFRGARRIDSLPAFPLAYHDDEEDVRTKLIERGRKFGALRGMNYKFYNGLAYFKKKKSLVRLNVNGRIMIDAATFRRINPNYRTSPVRNGIGDALFGGIMDEDSDGCDPLDHGDGDNMDDTEGEEINTSGAVASAKATSTKKESAESRMLRRTKAQLRSYITTADGKIQLVGGPPGGSSAERLAAAKKAKKSDEKEETGMLPETMTEEELLLCSPTVLGFSFGDKMWAEFAVAHIHEIIFNPSAFDSLVLPQEQKEIVRALVESQTGKVKGKRVGIDDVIKGKGRGLVAVLHGRPGVGKTLTAEGIAEYLKRPLYMVGAGELGTDPRTLEHQLSRILDISDCWNAVLLLDEADVFLERRSVHDLHRNALVSIFLRLLEYFQGILFLTTNRVETFDEAFQSRIHIALRYSDLDAKAKRQIWQTFIEMVAREEVMLKEKDEKKAGGDTETTVNGEKEEETKQLAEIPKEKLRQVVSKTELDTLSRRTLNGRQIKNAVRTAQALAVSQGEILGMKHLTLVLGVTEGFEHDLKGTGQIDGMMSYM